MKKLIVSFATMVLLLVWAPSHAKEGSKRNADSPISKEKTESVEVSALIARVNEINAMDKSSLSSAERKELRKELRSIKRDVNRHSSGGVVYISGGLVILILVLIILL